MCTMVSLEALLTLYCRLVRYSVSDGFQCDVRCTAVQMRHLPCQKDEVDYCRGTCGTRSAQLTLRAKSSKLHKSCIPRKLQIKWMFKMSSRTTHWNTTETTHTHLTNISDLVMFFYIYFRHQNKPYTKNLNTLAKKASIL